MPKKIIIPPNTRFNNLVVLKESDKRSGTKVLWECECDCGNITYATHSDLKSGHKKSCGCLQKQKASELGRSKKKNLLNMTFGKLAVLSETEEKDNDNRPLWLCQCSCGSDLIKVSSKDLLMKRKTHCGCDYQKSKGEAKIIELLNNANIPFKREYSYENLKNESGTKKLRFDFLVEDKYLIEYDGIQHFKSDSGYGSDLKNIQKRDELKNEYCRKNNLILIRIPYTHLDNLLLDDLLENSRFKIQ